LVILQENVLLDMVVTSKLSFISVITARDQEELTVVEVLNPSKLYLSSSLTDIDHVFVTCVSFDFEWTVP
jgi:hypothetical protein